MVEKQVNNIPHEHHEYSGVYVVIDSHPESIRLLRKAKRKAQKLNTFWEAIYVETPKQIKKASEEDKEQLTYSISLAKQMGASVKKIEAKTEINGVCDYLQNDILPKSKNPIFIIIGKVGGAYWLSSTSALERKLREFDNKKLDFISIPLNISFSRIDYLIGIFSFKFKEIFYCLLAVAIATLFIELIDYFLPGALTSENRNKTILYILVTTFAASRYGLLTGLITSIVSFLTLSFLYITPTVSLLVRDPADALNFILFMLTAVITAGLGNKDYNHRKNLIEQSRRLQSLIRLNRVSLVKRTRSDAIVILDKEISDIVHNDIVFFLPAAINPDKLEPALGKDFELNENDEIALYSCWNESRTTGLGTILGEDCNWRFEPLSTANDDIGVLGIKLSNKFELNSALGRLLTDIASQSSLILERLELNQALEENRIQSEREKLRSMLLSSVSHDLKTPLASIIGSLSVYRNIGLNLPNEQRIILINTALDEARRLDSFITNILDMTKIESGQIEFKKEWIDPTQLINQVARSLNEHLRKHELVILPPNHEEVEVSMDGMMMKQVLQNLLDNASKYAPQGTKIEIGWKIENDKFLFSVRDHGKGIPEDKLAMVFDKYARIIRQDSQVAGTGLGLAIVKAVLEAQAGTVSVQNHPEGGAIFILYLPTWRIKKEINLIEK